MGDVGIFLTAEALTLAAAAGVAAFVRRPLRNVLIDLTGTPERAAFWVAFTTLLLVLVPVVTVMFVPPDGGSGEPAFFRVVARLRWSLVGLVTTLVAYALVIIVFVQARPHQPPRD
ncbi:MAG TPA: hypothetical protein VGF55_10390 [Gemmataceae bacterium]|jgi:hypothetical protein